VWEVSTDADITAKANADYEKRLKNPGGVNPTQTTFVFVTPRRWAGKKDWVTARKSGGVWLDVRAYDAFDLEEWLELAPAVHIWFSVLAGKRPEEAIDLGNCWEDWSSATRPPMSPGVVLAGRDGVVETVHQWLSTSSLEPLMLRAETRDEAIAVLAATVQQLPAEERATCLSRTVVALSLLAWQGLAASTEPLILIAAFDNRTTVTRAIAARHQVVIPLDRSDGVYSGALHIPPVSRDAAARALVALGLDRPAAEDLGTLAHRSFTSFRRKLALIPEVHRPVWGRSADAPALVPVMLAGAWDQTKDGDRQAVAALAHVPYEGVSTTLIRWSNAPDPPVRRVGDAWFVVSKDDAWSLINQYVTRDNLERFETVVLGVLGAPDPRYDLPAEQRWMAAVTGHVPAHSSVLREDLADTLALMGARGEAVTVSAGITARTYATRIVRQLLERANGDWRLWASLSLLLPLLAEAAPDVFLSGVEVGLEGEQPILRNLFRDEEGLLGAGSPHTGMLWALEILAWYPEYLGRVALLLAKLTRLDPGGRLANRPYSSLRSIFLLWHPQTTATIDQRLRVLDMLRKQEPDVAWRLLLGLVPRRSEVGLNAATPRWRDWGADSPPGFSQVDMEKGAREVASRLLADVGESGSRWSDLIELLPLLPEEEFEVGLERLGEITAQALPSADRAGIWDTLRDLVAQHRSFPEADWALPQADLDRLDAILKSFEPEDLTMRYAWLFGNRATLPEARRGDWRERERALADARGAAMRTIYTRNGLAAVLDFVGEVERPGEVGMALGHIELPVAEEDELLRANLASGDPARASFARGFVVGRLEGGAYAWVEGKLTGLSKDWSPDQRAELLVCLRRDEHTDRLVEATDAETQHLYWRKASAYGIPEPEVERVARKFLEHSRPHAAVGLLAFHADRLKGHPTLALIADALEQSLQTPPPEDFERSTFSHDLSELLDVLVSSKDAIGTQRIAALEWRSLPVLGRFVRPPKLLHRELARDPELFLEAAGLIYGSGGKESPQLTPEEEARVRMAFELLDSWRTVPGSTEDGRIDSGELKAWVHEARALAAARGLQSASDHMIGRVLSAGPAGEDGTWPHPAIREVIEDVSSAELDSGFDIGVYNSRGTVTKSLTEGGAQERELAEKYESLAKKIADGSPRTAAILRGLAANYRAEAVREDQRAELRQDLNRW